MDSPVPRRRDWKPLLPVNYSRMEPNSSDQMKQKLIETSACDGEKENGLTVDSAAIRRRKEMMRLERERERTEEVLTKRERELESRVKELERRDVELRRLEIEIYRLIKVKDRQSSSKILPHLRSLRAKEEEKKIMLGF